MAFWRKAKKSPFELVKAVETNLSILTERKDDGEELEKPYLKAQDKCTQYLHEMLLLTRGDAAHEAKPEAAKKLVELLENSSLVEDLVYSLESLNFEGRTAAVQNVQYAFKEGDFEKWLSRRPEFVEYLCQSYGNTDLALHCGPILRSALRYAPICRMVLGNSKLFHPFFDYVQNPAFDVSSDAFSTFREILTRHPDLSCVHLEENFDEVFERYNELLVSEHYVSKRLALKLLSELLLSRPNFNVMILYINDPENLKIIMNLLKEKGQKNIQYEAFHVFKIFVANPNKGGKVLEILARNKDRLIPFLKKFHPDKDDDQFLDEKQILLEALRQMKKPVVRVRQQQQVQY